MARKSLSTTDLAKAAGVHPNTDRLYEAWGFLPPIPRSARGYRLYTEGHRDQMVLARTLLQWPYPGGKGIVVEIVTHAAQGDLGGALEGTYTYLARVRAERAQAEAAASLLERWAQGVPADATARPLTIGAVAQLLGVSVDMLRNWERNGLLHVPRDPRNGYRRYGAAEISRLRVIRTLSRAGYSLMAILRMLTRLDAGQTEDLRAALDTPRPGEDAVYIADRWLSTLADVERRVLEAIALLERMLLPPG